MPEPHPVDEAAAWFGPPLGPPGDGEEAGPGESMFQLIGSRWVVAVLHELGGPPVRYNTLHRRLHGISHKMLTQTLRRLQRARLVRRQSHPTVPPHVDYQLTDAGTELLEQLVRLELWAAANGLGERPAP